MSTSSQLQMVFTHPAVQEFGATLRRSLRMNDDFASIMDLEFAETPEAFADALKRFLRRFETFADREKLRRPSRVSLEQLAALVDSYGVKLVRAALISHALVRAERDVEESTDMTEQEKQEGEVE